MGVKRVQEPVQPFIFPDRLIFHYEQVLSRLSVRLWCVSANVFVLDGQVSLSPMV